MLNSLRDGQINYGTTNYSSAHVPPHNVVPPNHQNSHIPTEPTTPVVYPWNSNPRLDHLYGFHSRYYNLDFPTPYPPATNQYVPANMYGQNVPQCCQPCCRLRSQNIPKTSPPQVLYNPIRPVQPLNRSYKSKNTLKTSCSEQFLPYIPNDIPVKYDTQNCYQQKYSNSYLNNTNYCPPANNLWIPPAANPTWPTERLRPVGRHPAVISHDYSRDKNYQRLPNYQSNPYPNPTSNTHKPYNYIPPIPDVHDYRSSTYHNSLKNNTPEYISHEQNSRLPTSSQNNQSSPSYLQQYYNTHPVQSYSDVQRPSESFRPSQITPQNSTKSNLNVREFLANWDEGEEETNEKSSEAAAPIVVLDCMTLEGEALTKIQEKLNVVSYENLEKVLKENQNPLVINTEPNEIDPINNKARLPSKSNFEPLDYTKRETGIIKPFINEKKNLPQTNGQPEKSYSVNFDGMVAWYGKKNTDISSTDLIERLADRIFNLSKSQENEGVSFGTAAYTGQITQTNRSIASSIKDSSKYTQSQQMFNLQHTNKCIEPSVINKIDYNNDPISRISSCVMSESNKASTVKSNHMNSSCIVENITKKCLNVTNEDPSPWNIDQGSQEQHLNMSLYDHSGIIKPLDFSSLTDETKGNPFVFEKNSSSIDKSNNGNDEFNKVLNENGNYNSMVSSNQHSIHQLDSNNRNFPVIVSPNIQRQEYSVFHESVIQRTGCDKNKHDKVPAQSDFEGMNWNMSNDLEIMKNTNMTMEPSCLYDRNNYNILDNMNCDKNVTTQWKDDVPCVDLTVNSKTNTPHDSFFDSWGFIENYENNSNRKINNLSTNNNVVHNQLFPNQINLLVETNTKNNISSEKVGDETLATIKDVPFSKPHDISSNNNNMRSRDVFNIHNRIPDFSDGFELPNIDEPHEYMSFKKPSNDTENRTDGSIFEHLTEPKCNRTANEITNTKNDQNKSDIVGLPNFKDKEPLAPMLVPPKLNIVKPIIRDPSQMYSVIKQKIKYDSSNIVNDSCAISNKTGHGFNDNQMNVFNVTDFKSKYNSVLNQYDVWSEKFVLKSDLNRSSSAVVQCDVEVTQFKSTPENRDTFISKTKINENYQEKDTKLLENTNGVNLTANKINVIENDKINSTDFIHCLGGTKTDDQKYRDTLDEFETSFGFDMHCNNESNKSFHEGIVDKCLEERIQDQIGEHNINNTTDSNNSSNNTTSNNTRLPFECDFQSGYLIKNYFDENKNKAVVFDQKKICDHEKSDTTTFNFHSEIQLDFELQSNKNKNIIQSSEKDSDFNILNSVNHNIKQIRCSNEKEHSNFIDQDNSKHSFELIHEDTNISVTSPVEKNNVGCLTIEDHNFEFDNEEKNIIDLSNSKGITEATDHGKINDSSSNVYKLSNIPKHSGINFELNIDNTNIFESNSSTISLENKTKTNELENNKNSFETTFNSDSKTDIEHHINDKSSFELENNNSDIYQTQNFEKIHDFDFETRIIQNLEMECSNSNVHKPISQKKTYDNEKNIKSMFDYEVIDESNNAQNEINVKRFSNTSEKVQVEETSNFNCNDGTDRNDVINTDLNDIINTVQNQVNLVDRVFENDFTAENNKKENSNSEIRRGFDVQNENTEDNNHKNHDTQNNFNLINDAEVRDNFENLNENFTNLNTEKDDSNLSENCCRYDDKCGVHENQENIEDQNLKIENSEIAFESVIEKKTDETLKNSNNFQEFEDNSYSSTTSVSSLQSENNLNEDNNEILTRKECNLIESNLHENFLDSSNITMVYKNTPILEKQRNTDIKQSHIELINQNNIHTIKNKAVDIVQGDVTKNAYENIKYDLVNTLENTNKTLYNNDGQNNHSIPSLLNNAELIYQKNSSEIVELNKLTYSEPSSLNHLELICQRYSSDIIEVKEKICSKRNLSNRVESKYHQHSNNIFEVDNPINVGSSSLNHVELTGQQYSNAIFEVEVAKNSGSNSINNVESTFKHYSNNNDKVEESTNSESISLHQLESISNKHSDELVEYPTYMKSSELSVPKKNEVNESYIKNNIDSASVDEDRKLPRVKFTLKSHSKNITKTNIFDEEIKKSNVIEDKQLSVRHIFKKRNKLYKPWKCIYRKESIGKPQGIIKEVVETECPIITINSDSITQNLQLPIIVAEEDISLTQFNQEQCNKSDTNEQFKDILTNDQCSDSITSEQSCDSVTNEHCYDSVPNEQFSSSVTNEKCYEKLNVVENQEIDNNAFVSIVDDHPNEVFSRQHLCTPVPSPFDDFQSETSTPDYCGGEEYWDKSLENEYKTVLNKAISKLAKHRVNIRDKFNIRLLARRVIEVKQGKRRRRRLDKIKRIDNTLDKLAVGDIAIVECPPTAVLQWNVMAVKTVNPICKIKVQLPWGRIFNLNSQGAEDHQRIKDTKLELGPAKVEVRLSRTPGEWQVAACRSMVAPKSVVSVKRLVLQRVASPAKVYDEIQRSPAKDSDEKCSSPAKYCDETHCSLTMNSDNICCSPAKDCDGICSSPVNDCCDSIGGSPGKGGDNICCSPAKDYDDVCNSPTRFYDDGYSNHKTDNDDSYSSANESNSDGNSSSSFNTGPQQECSRKLPKIVIRRNGQNNNYTSHVSGNGIEGGDDNNDDTPQLMVRLVRDRKLDEMAAGGVTTLDLRHLVPISESAADTQDVKRARYT